TVARLTIVDLTSPTGSRGTSRSDGVGTSLELTVKRTGEQTPAQRDFRAAMASLSAAVSVITTDGPRGRSGITVSAVCSVTDTPPTLLVCVNRSSYLHDILDENRRICVNVLGPGHEELALHFAGAKGTSM